MTQSVTWPEKARCAIMMMFDLDGEYPKKDVWWPKPAELARFWLEQSQSRTAR